VRCLRQRSAMSPRTRLARPGGYLVEVLDLHGRCINTGSRHCFPKRGIVHERLGCLARIQRVQDEKAVWIVLSAQDLVGANAACPLGFHRAIELGSSRLVISNPLVVFERWVCWPIQLAVLDRRTATRPRSATHARCASARRVSLPQTMRTRLRRVAASEPFGPLTQFARPSVAAKSPAPSVDSATISIEEMASSRSGHRSWPWPNAHGKTRAGARRVLASLEIGDGESPAASSPENEVPRPHNWVAALLERDPDAAAARRYRNERERVTTDVPRLEVAARPAGPKERSERPHRDPDMLSHAWCARCNRHGHVHRSPCSWRDCRRRSGREKQGDAAHRLMVGRAKRLRANAFMHGRACGIVTRRLAGSWNHVRAAIAR